eukprot:c18205_g1_i1 orf=201-935(-)
MKGKSFKESLKALEADIQLANTLALSFPSGQERACLQMKLKYGCAAHILSFFIKWTDCRLAGSLGLLRILIYKVMKDGSSAMSASERKASLREFYACILPSLLVLEGVSAATVKSYQHASFMDKFKKRPHDGSSEPTSQQEVERERECGICFDDVPKIVLPDCSHALCVQCYRDWRVKSQSCPFCRVNLERVDSKDLWIYVDYTDVEDAQTVAKYNVQRLFMYIDKLPLIVNRNSFSKKRRRSI